MKRFLKGLRHRRGAAVLVILVLGTVLFMLMATAIESYYQLHRQNRAAQQRLQERVSASGLAVHRSDADAQPE